MATRLPIEVSLSTQSAVQSDVDQILQSIALHIDDDKDFCSFMLANKFIAHATSDPTFWRLKFRKGFDTPVAGQRQDMGVLYKHRKEMLKPAMVKFKSAFGKRNPEVVQVLKDLILGPSVHVCPSQR
jgi:hypothetical protein